MQEHEDVELQAAWQEHDANNAINPPRQDAIIAMARADLK